MDDVGDEESAELWMTLVMTLVMKRVQSYG